MSYPHAPNGYWEYGPSGYPIVGGSDITVLEDFEDQSLAAYDGDPNFEIQSSNVLQGQWSLASQKGQIVMGNDGSEIPTPREELPIEYRARVVLEDDGVASLLTNVQSSDWPWRNCYALLVDTRDRFREIRLLARDGNSTHYFERPNIRLSTGTEYWPAITVTEDGINGALYDSSGRELMRTDSYADTTHTGGGLGWHNGVGDRTYFDYATARPGQMGDVSEVIINDFEDGNLKEYEFEDDDWDDDDDHWKKHNVSAYGGYDDYDDWKGYDKRHFASPAAAVEGDYGLEMIGYGWLQTDPSKGGQNYIRDGVPFAFTYNFRDDDHDEYYLFSFCVDEADEWDDVYTLEFDMDGAFRLQKNWSWDKYYDLPGDSSEGRDEAVCYDVHYHDDVNYRIGVEVDSSEGIYAELRSPSGDVKAWVEAPDTEFIDDVNGYGHHCTEGGHLYCDWIVEEELAGR